MCNTIMLLVNPAAPYNSKTPTKTLKYTNLYTNHIDLVNKTLEKSRFFPKYGTVS